MAALTWKGKLTIFGVEGSFTIAGSAVSHLKQQSWNHRRTPKIVELENELGQVEGVGEVEAIDDFDVTFTPFSTSSTNAQNALQHPTAIAKVVASSTKTNTTRGINGDYLCVGSEFIGENSGKAMFRLTLRRYPNVSIDASLS